MSTQDSGNSQPLFPSLCKNGCGFFSGIDSKGFCSVCYKKYLKKEAAEKSEAGEADDTTTAVLAQLSLKKLQLKSTRKKLKPPLLRLQWPQWPRLKLKLSKRISHHRPPPLMEPQLQSQL